MIYDILVIRKGAVQEVSTMGLQTTYTYSIFHMWSYLRCIFVFLVPKRQTFDHKKCLRCILKKMWECCVCLRSLISCHRNVENKLLFILC